MDNEKFEELVLNIMREAEEDGEPVDRKEAEEMAKMEIGAKEIKRYEQAETKKERKPKERKVDEEKGMILREVRVLIQGMLSNLNQSAEVTMKNETELSFLLNGNSYTLKLTKHRPKKQGGRHEGVAQLVEHLTFNQVVEGSSPSALTVFLYFVVSSS